VKLLLENEGITEAIRKAFVTYLASHDRPMHELLDPKPKNLRRIFENEFTGMIVDEVNYDELIVARETLLKTLTKTLTDGEKEFLAQIGATELGFY